MKKLCLLIISLLLLNLYPIQAQEVQEQDALTVAQSFLELRWQEQDFTIHSVQGFIPDDCHLAWVINLGPTRFVKIPPTKKIRPSLAY